MNHFRMSESPPPVLRKSAPFPKALVNIESLILALGSGTGGVEEFKVGRGRLFIRLKD